MLNQQKKEVHSKTRKLKAHLTQQEMVNNELAVKLKQQEVDKVGLIWSDLSRQILTGLPSLNTYIFMALEFESIAINNFEIIWRHQVKKAFN